jgi:hypothetical protein
LHVTVALAQLSAALAANSTLCEHRPGSVLVWRLSGQMMLGGSMSPTVIVREHERLHPFEFTTIRLTVRNPGAIEATVTACWFVGPTAIPLPVIVQR